MKLYNKDQYQRVDAELLIPGRGSPIEIASLVYCDSKIVFAGPTKELPMKFNSIEGHSVPVLMPGLWDCHVHFWGAERFNLDTMVATPQPISGIRSVRDVVATLNAGFTSVRELAGYGVQLAQVIGEGWIPGPNIYSSVSMLSQTAGHGDSRIVPETQLRDQVAHGLPIYVCDGPVECVKAVRAQVRRGASVIKVAASGGVVSIGDDVQAQQFSDEELEAIVKEAARNNLAVAAHCHGGAAIEAALRAGCRTIEHGSFLDDDKLIKLMLEKDAILVATISVGEYVVSDPSSFNPDQYRKALEVQKHHQRAYREAVKAGVRCAIGTDLGVSSLDKTWNHGKNGGELAYAVKAGMTPLQAIEAATANGPLTLGPKAPKSGQLREGYDADFIALSSNPLDDISTLADPSQVLKVWKGGKLYKDGQPISILKTTKHGSV